MGGGQKRGRIGQDKQAWAAGKGGAGGGPDLEEALHFREPVELSAGARLRGAREEGKGGRGVQTGDRRGKQALVTGAFPRLAGWSRQEEPRAHTWGLVGGVPAMQHCRGHSQEQHSGLCTMHKALLHLHYALLHLHCRKAS